jgi:hypothetical protein
MHDMLIHSSPVPLLVIWLDARYHLLSYLFSSLFSPPPPSSPFNLVNWDILAPPYTVDIIDNDVMDCGRTCCSISNLTFLPTIHRPILSSELLINILGKANLD